MWSDKSGSLEPNRNSLERLHLSALVNARFHTDRCNYDNGWPALSDTEGSNKEGSLPNEGTTNPVNKHALIQSLENSMESNPRLKEQLERRKKQLLSIQNDVRQEINSKYSSFPSECTIEQIKHYLDSFTEVSRARIDRQKQRITKLQGVRQHLNNCADLTNPIAGDRSQTITERQTKFLEKWNMQKFEWVMDSSNNDRFRVRIKSSSSDLPADRTFALVRGDKQCNNLEVICNQCPEIDTVSQCASSALAPGALMAELLANKFIDESLRADINRLRSQHAIEYDGHKRQLSLTTGRSSDVLAILSIGVDGFITLVDIRYQPQAGAHEASNTNLKAKLDSFNPPSTKSFDTWISEVEDFCKTIV